MARMIWMGLQLAISYFFYGMALISMSCFMLLSIAYWKRERSESERLDKARADMGDIKAIYKTMRDIVEQQKQLAHEFNEDLDKKLQVVKQVLGQSLARNEELYERQLRLTREMDTAAVEINNIQRQLDALDATMLPGLESEKKRTVTRRPAETERRVPESPANPERARNAFRELLEMQASDEQGAPAPFPSPDNGTETTENSAAKESATSVRALQKQVEEYSAAGVSIADIAEKLNIGKGEVRLILSLKK